MGTAQPMAMANRCCTERQLFMLSDLLSLACCHAAAASPTPCPALRIHDTDLKYYANGEDAYEMRRYFKEKKPAKEKKAKEAALAAS